MSVTGAFNALHGETVQRAYLESLLDASWRSKDPLATDVAARVKKLLQSFPKAQEFTVNVESPVAEGLYGLLPEPLEEELSSEGLGKPVSSDDVYQKVTDLVLEAIEKYGDLPWRKPWESVQKYGLPATNYISKKPYRGVNAALLNIILPALRKKPFKNPYFLTFKQVEERGGRVKKGAQGYMVIYFSVLHKVGGKKISEREYWKLFAACAGNNPSADLEEKCKTLQRIPFLRYYKVFNGDDIEGIDFELPEVKPRSNQEKIDVAEAVVSHYPKAPKIGHGGDSAHYVPARDEIQMPELDTFNKLQEYYSTLFHECVHSTGHHTRLERKMTGRFGTKDYAFEELIAEMGANYLNAEAGILYFTLKNSASYLKGWSKKLREEMKKDNKFFFRACSAAQEAADYILDRDKSGRPAYMKSLDLQPVKKTKPTESKQLEMQLAGNDDALNGPIDTAREVVQTTKNAVSAVRELSDDLMSLFVTADKSEQVQRPDTFRLPGKIGEFMQDLQRYKLAILLKGDPHAGKSEFVKQLINGFLQFGDRCALFDLEQGGLASKDTIQSIERNIDKSLRKNLSVAAEAPGGIETIKKAANHFDVVVIDSWQKLGIPNSRFDELRHEYPNTVFIVIFQQNGEGGTRGGVTADYDAPVSIKVKKVDETFENNYAYFEKNRGNQLTDAWLILREQIIDLDAAVAFDQ